MRKCLRFFEMSLYKRTDALQSRQLEKIELEARKPNNFYLKTNTLIKNKKKSEKTAQKFEPIKQRLRHKKWNSRRNML